MTENHFHTTPVIGTRIFIFPGDALRPLVAGKPRTGQATSPAAHILMAHTSMVQRTVSELSPAGAHASRNALLELAKGLILDHFDDREPTFTPAPAQAAKDLADAQLTDAELSPTAIAAQLHVPVGTLQRTFASLDESFSAYIRRRRLEEAVEALTASGSRLSLSEAAALWHFTDSSHFIRAFKKQIPCETSAIRTPADVTTQPDAIRSSAGKAATLSTTCWSRPREWCIDGPR
ncbi:helix-turn-helix domain-containing protein [Streptomyces mirabilis]|uniref:helix-turn-helix domain-containing protein n=1 Tax=Streptomyces mirabilis TaxID=68239 RepID=UPI00362DD752